MVTRDELVEQKEKLIRDKQTVETRLESVRKEADSLVSTLSALEGAMQTVEFFLNKETTPTPAEIDDEEPSKS